MTQLYTTETLNLVTKVYASVSKEVHKQKNSNLQRSLLLVRII